MSEVELEVYRALRDAQNRYAYFLLAAAGAAIGFALNQTANAGLNWMQLPLAGGVLCWGLSFFCGCRCLAYAGSTLFANAELFRVEAGQHPEAGRQPDMIAAASASIRQAIESNSVRGNRYGHWQFRFLIGGAMFYIAWHVAQMYARSQAPLPA